MDSCLVLNGNSRGVYARNYYYGSSSNVVSLKGTNFTQIKHSLDIQASNVEVAFNRFYDNVCSDNGCVSLHIQARHSVNFYANLVHGNAASQILNIGNIYSGDAFYADIFGNIFEANIVPDSTSGSKAVLVMQGEFSFSDVATEIWKIHSNEFSNARSKYEMSSAAVNADTEVYKINATNNYFKISGSAINLTSSAVDSRLFDDDESPSSLEIIFRPYLTNNNTFVCPLNCFENGLCVFPGVCICKDGWSGESCSNPTCSSLSFCSGNGVCR